MQDLIAIARDAGRRILEVYASDFAVTAKDDRSPLTEADLAAHRLIVERLRALTPGTPILSEEAADIPYAERKRWTRYWLVDPLDGTRGFVARDDEFSVNIALIEDGVPVQGVVHAPVAGTTWHGVRGGGAFRDGAPIHTRVPAAYPPRVVGSRTSGGGALAALLERLGEHEMVRISSAVKFGLVAEGAADFYPRFGPTSEWDTAAGQCIVEAAGGVVLAPDGEPLRYNRKDSLLNPGFIVSGDPGAEQLAWIRAALPGG